MTEVQLRTDVRLTPTQRGLLAAHLRDPESPARNTAVLVRFGGEVDVARLADAFHTVVMASDCLRMQVTNGERAQARVSRELPSSTTTVDVEPTATPAWAQDLATAAFDLSTSCYRSAIASHTNGTASWLLAVHHIATDATSSKTIVDRTVAAYLGESTPESRFFRHARGQALDPPVASVEFWKDRQISPSIGRLYSDIDSASSQVARRQLPISAARLDEVEAGFTGEYPAVTRGLGWAAFLITATAVYITKIAGVTEFAIGVPVHHRQSADTRKLIGPLMGVYPLDIALEADDTFQSLHKRVSASLLTVIRHAHLGLTPPADYEAVVNVILEAGSTGTDALQLTTEWLDVGAIDPGHLLRVFASDYAVEGAVGRTLAIDARDDTDRTARHLTRVIELMTAAPGMLISAATLCTDDEAVQITAAESSADFPNEPPLVPSRLQARLQSSDQPAIEDERSALTGRELWRRVIGVAEYLDNNAPAGARIGIEMGPSIGAIVAIFATTVSGRSFVPLDPSQPVDRRQALTTRADIAIVLTRELIASVAPADNNRVDNYVVAPDVDPSTEAYLLFTSGSSGVPKGVAITHGGIARYVEFALNNYFENTSAIAPLFTALTFDLTLTTVFAPLLGGGRLVAFEQPGASVLPALAARTDLTWCKATPSHLEVLLSVVPDGESLHFENLVVGGESFGADLAEALLRSNPTMAIFNEYGPTEAVVGCMIHRVDPATTGEGVVPIGVPAPGVVLRVVDAGGQRVPVGVAGELLIASRSLFDGYLGESDLHESPFVVHEGTRFYKSGDLVVRNRDMVLTYLGRIDEQIKVGGIRLDPTEIEQALQAHPAIDKAVVRLWSPAQRVARRRCVRCGLPDSVPGSSFDEDNVCNSCHAYDAIAPTAASWFRTETDLQRRIGALDARGEYDCLSLLSGGKDSTYALHRLVDLGFRPYVLTLDNGFLSEQAKDNCRRVTADLELDHEFATSPVMNDIFRESLATYSDVCHGCFKTIYTVASTRARELHIPALVTGLSRGQLFQTRLIPEQFGDGRFDSEAIDRAVIEARKRYHRAPDAINRLLATDLFDTDEIFDELVYIDFYRYVDVPLADMLTYLETETAWRRPTDTGRSTNCLINVAGISTHQRERGYHNYAEPYAWDVRLGHKTRDESIAELNDDIDATEVAAILAQVGYAPKVRQTLAAWMTLTAGSARAPSAAELRTHLMQHLPRYAIPAAYLPVAEIPTTKNGKVDLERLPPPELRHHAAFGMSSRGGADTESHIIELWKVLLGRDDLGPEDDFFASGGDSLAALRMIVELSQGLNRMIPAELAFVNTTPQALAAAIEYSPPDELPTSRRPIDPVPIDITPPPLATVELSMRYESERFPDRPQLNLGRYHEIAGRIDPERFAAAARNVAARHGALSWSHREPRRRLDAEHAVAVTVLDGTQDGPSDQELQAFVREPFDLQLGPLMRILIATTAVESSVTIAVHHACGDKRSLEVLWHEIDALYHGQLLHSPTIDTADLRAWQSLDTDRHLTWFQETFGHPVPDPAPLRQLEAGDDGLLWATTTTSSTDVDSRSQGLGASTALAASAIALSPWYDGVVETCLVASTRDHPLAQDLVGYLLNPIPVRIELEPETSLGEIHERARTALTRVLPHRAVPYAEINSHMRKAGLTPPSARVLVSVIDDPPATFGAQQTPYRTIFTGDAVADISFFVNRSGEQVSLGVEYRGSAVGRDTAEVVLRRFTVAFEALHQNPELSLSNLIEPKAMSFAHGGDAAGSGLLVDAVIAHCESGGDRPAIECETRTISWAALGSRAAQVAAALTRRGVGPGDRVIVHLEASEIVPIVMLGVLAVGGVYIPVDPTHPIGRRQAIFEASGAQHVVASGTTAGEFGRESMTVTGDGIDGSSWRNDLQLARHSPISPDDPAYVIFTSGSTGKPNGVAISHRQMTASTRARAGVYPAGPKRFLLLSSPAFDSSLVGLLWTLDEGGTLIVASAAAAMDPDALVSLLASSTPSHVLCVPTLYRLLLGRSAPGTPWAAHVIVAGEGCSRELVRTHFERFGDTPLTNEYGPTECTVWATAHHCRSDDHGPVPIGTPIPGTWIAVVDGHGRLCDMGVPGELVIGGILVADGYLDNAGGDRFGGSCIGFPNAATGRTFRTGDRAVMHDGAAWFLGRHDDQLNIGGTRVDPGEVEAVLERVNGVSNVAVVASDRRSFDELISTIHDDEFTAAMRHALTSDKPTDALRSELGRYGTPRPAVTAHVEGSTVAEADLRAMATTQLPNTARPTDYVFHDELPRGPNGKIDRSALRALEPDPQPLRPTPGRATHDSIGLAPDRVAEIFAAVLGRSQISTRDSFFDLGGDSLAAFEVVRRLEVELSQRVSLRVVHAAPTAESLAVLLRAGAPIAADPLAEDLVAQSLSNPKSARHHAFFLHHIGPGGVLAQGLAEALGSDFSLTTLIDGRSVHMPFERSRAGTRFVSVNHLTDAYADEIERLQGSGPLIVIGFCQGGIYAHEVAAELDRRGRTVALLVCIRDWHAPDGGHVPIERHTGFLRLVARTAEQLLARRQSPQAFFGAKWRRVGAYVSSAVNAETPWSRTRRIGEQTFADHEGHTFSQHQVPTLIIRSSEDPYTPQELGQQGWASVLDNYRVEYVRGDPSIGTVVEDVAELIRRALDG